MMKFQVALRVTSHGQDHYFSTRFVALRQHTIVTGLLKAYIVF